MRVGGEGAADSAGPFDLLTAGARSAPERQGAAKRARCEGPGKEVELQSSAKDMTADVPSSTTTPRTSAQARSTHVCHSFFACSGRVVLTCLSVHGCARRFVVRRRMSKHTRRAAS